MVKFRMIQIKIDCGDKTCGECRFRQSVNQLEECSLFKIEIQRYEEKDKIFQGMWARCADCFLAEITALRKE